MPAAIRTKTHTEKSVEVLYGSIKGQCKGDILTFGFYLSVAIQEEKLCSNSGGIERQTLER